MENVINERNWELFLEAINAGNVVPVIGKEILFIREGEKTELLQNCLVRTLAEKFEEEFIEGMNYTPIVNKIAEQNFRNKMLRLGAGNTTDIYFEINLLLKHLSLGSSELVKQLLSIRKFPLILTTAFDPIIENTMREVFEDIEVYAYDKTLKSDIPESSVLTHPTLYHLFGKVNKIASSYVVTEDDLLEFLHCWHNEDNRPRNLSHYLRDKFLLVLGCDYPNWLFRFLWYSMKNFSLTPYGDSAPQGLVSNSLVNRDGELVDFLSRIQAHVFGDTLGFIEELTKRWDNYLKERGDTVSGSKKQGEENPGEEVEIFISYAHEDIEVADKIARTFLKYGAKVWFDKRTLHSGDDYPLDIKINIQKTRRFVPVLSQNTLNSDSRFLRREWTWALQELECRLLIPYIAPVVIDQVDLNDRLIPQPFRDIQVIDFRNADFENEVVRLIRSIRTRK